MTTQTTIPQATPIKLHSGEWGAKVGFGVEVGDSIQIVTKGGKRWITRVTKVVWYGDDSVIVATANTRTPTSWVTPRRRLG